MLKQVQHSDSEWARLQDMSYHLLDAAKDSDWERMIELHAIRQPIIEQYFNDVAPTLDGEVVRDRIYVLQATEKQILQYSLSMRADVAKELQTLHRGKKVEQAYHSHAVA